MQDGKTTDFAYDASGNVICVTDAEGRSVSFVYDAAGNRTETIYPNGSKETSEYDAYGNLLRTSYPSGQETEYVYDTCGRCVGVTENGQTTVYEYDYNGRCTKETYEDGSSLSYEYDALGRLTRKRDPLGQEMVYVYTVTGTLETVTYADGSSNRFDYDAAGNLISETDGEGYVTCYEYDGAGRLVKTVNPLGNASAYEYDENDNLCAVTDANGNKTFYSYDVAGNLTAETDGVGNTVVYEYTKEGYLSTITKADGKRISYTYDKTGLLTGADYAGEGSVDNSYNELGLLTVTKGMEGTTSYQYNEDGKLLSVATPDGDTVSYTYNEKGLKAGITYPDGSQVQYAYDSMGRLGSVTGLDGGITEYEYDAAGRRTKTVSENRTITYTYDEGNRLTGLNVAGDVQLSFGYTYDKNGSMTSETLSGDGMDTTSRYTYDLAGQLTGFSRTDGYEECYAYDPAGNMTERICKAQGGEEYALSMAYDQADRLVRMERAAKERKITGIVYRYDENGNLTSKTSDIGTDTYHYNAMDQLTSYEGYDGYQAKYAYQDTGVLLRKETKGNLSRLTQEEVLEGKSVSGEIDIEEGAAGIGAADMGSQIDAGDWIVTSYVYDINQEYEQVLSETTQGQTTCYEYGLERISAYGPDGKTDYLYDGRGSVAEQLTTGTDLAENVKKVIKSYNPYGEQLNEKLSGFGYNGEEYDRATGTVYLRARWYEPAMARFAQKDIERGELTDTISQNRYLYAANDPVNYTDPSGEFLVKRQTVWDRFGQTVKSVVEPNSNQNAKTRMPSVDRKSILNHTRPLTPFESMIAPQIYQEEVRSKVEWKNKYSGSPIKDPGWGNYTETLQKVEQQEKKARDAKLENFAETICKANGLSDKIDKKTYQSLSSQEKLLYICAEAEKKRKYESFWNRKDGYFGGNWWQDERKVKEATHMLLLEADQNHGVIDLPQTSASGDKNKIYTLQVLLNVKRTGYYDHTMLTSYEAMQVREKKTNDPHKIEARDIKKMYEEYETWPYKKLDNFMENGGEDIVTGIFILTLDGITRFDNQEHDSYETSENKGVGNPIKIEGRGSSGRTTPNTIEEQMAMHQVKSNPLDGANKLELEMQDPRWPASEGWIKMQSIVKNHDGSKTVIHFVYNERTGAFDDFKYK